MNDLFANGPRTSAFPSATGSLTLDAPATVQIEKAFREAHRGFVRVRAVTPTNRIATSAGQPIQR